MSQKPPQIFDRALLRQRKARTMTAAGAHDFLFREVGDRLLERVGEINRRFDQVLVLGEPIAGLETALPNARLVRAWNRPGPGRDLVLDEEYLPFKPASFDLVLALGGLHWVNDLPGCLIQLRHCLRPDGLLLAAMAGGNTLQELRQAFLEADLEAHGGASPRIAPFADVRDIGGLLQRAGFAMPVADADRITVHYRRIDDLLADLRGMGESAAMVARAAAPTRRDALGAMAAAYQRRYMTDAGLLPASFDIVYLSGWAPAAGQPKPKKPGSATARLADALGTREFPAGDKAGPKTGK
ncbi:MAG: methyltransferase domain-containing protein [Sphingomonadales bacterium]